MYVSLPLTAIRVNVMEALESHTRRPRLRTGQAAAYLGLSQASLEKYRVKGGGPRFYKIGQICIYSPEDLDEWADQFARRSTSDPGSIR